MVIAVSFKIELNSMLLSPKWVFIMLCIYISTYVIFLFFFIAARKDLKDENEEKVPQFKKKAKELRILDAKTAQNLCK